MKIKFILLVSLIIFSTKILANESLCQKFNYISDKEKILIDSSQSGYKVIGKDKAYFYSAPNFNCKINKLFLIEGDLANAYFDYSDFTFIMYLDKKGKIIEGWIESNRLTPTGTGIGPSDKNK
ncbi:hypothetical protein I4905_14250 [Proteus mirabilis]|uniref:hypothetical protein n=1 Tax=Proteus mirabilis TaxID=584 RepID=UPI000F5BC5B7|nr:hypothetical protein [Proteus mirabilis]EKV7661481.1 hypothetical protein [Proteus mirabilis]MBG2919111.1 hypothetical protein [Proteus mirabilis]MBG2989128.1 hypothetical protein [Proteus mirabilis]MBI6184829.1 hypothetical protein [Proteus mirabilis]MBI6537499.1 hypothetical protein [Proteus mirabilis]